MIILKSLVLFFLAGCFEIGGCYLVWLWLRNGKPVWYGILGLIALMLYSFVPLLQNSNFGRFYAAYGGFFIVLAMFWAWKVDKVLLDKWDILGALVCLAGVAIIMQPRR